MVARVQVRQVINDEGNKWLRIVRRSSGWVVPGADGPAVRAGHGRAGDREGDVHQPGRRSGRAAQLQRFGFDSLQPKYGAGRPPKFAPCLAVLTRLLKVQVAVRVRTPATAASLLL